MKAMFQEDGLTSQNHVLEEFELGGMQAGWKVVATLKPEAVRFLMEEGHQNWSRMCLFTKFLLKETLGLCKKLDIANEEREKSWL